MRSQITFCEDKKFNAINLDRVGATDGQLYPLVVIFGGSFIRGKAATLAKLFRLGRREFFSVQFSVRAVHDLRGNLQSDFDVGLVAVFFNFVAKNPK